MYRLNVLMPCGKEICFFIHEDQRVHCNHKRLLNALNERGVAHFNGNRYFPKDGEIFLEALHDFYCLKGLSVKAA